ncbi:DUF1654 domain-containing protein [Pseudomonas rhizophila]|uniref:DUF1654 domain-containing protein n=1 Tax=Pseudomonas rhizophila TaxID=2045200 RepID=A0ABM6UMN4_9PSED|nr:DUF1654 domain-containing protein [Pseudomonas rhizophila]AVU78790.1 hypothetical protein CRX69_18515 [Pseudomonas rhizophila]
MSEKQKQEPHGRYEITGIERLGLRVSNMINHPVAQIQRWVTIHRLDSDGDREWEEVIGVLSETDGIDMTFNDDGSVTLRWEFRPEDGRAVDMDNASEISLAEPEPF